MSVKNDSCWIIFSCVCYFYRLAWSEWQETVRMFTGNIIGWEYIWMSRNSVHPLYNPRLFFLNQFCLHAFFLLRIAPFVFTSHPPSTISSTKHLDSLIFGFSVLFSNWYHWVQWSGSVGTGACCWARWPEYDFRDLGSRQGEPFLAGYPLCIQSE